MYELKNTDMGMKTIKMSILLLVCLVNVAFADKSFKVCWSHYTGWEPWGYIADKGLMKKWADKYGIEVKIERVNDYIESINLYTSGEYDACTMTNMDALTIPAVGGVDSEALIVGDFSNGNDGVVAKNAATISDLKGREVKLVELSVSHYLLARALEMNSLKEKEIKVVNTSDADIGALFLSDSNGAAVTWNPILMQARNGKGVKLLFDSSKIPGEIIDLMVVRKDADKSLKAALRGAWYEAMQIMSGKGPDSKTMLDFMAAEAGGTLAEFNAQLKTTKMFFTQAEADEFVQSSGLKKTMDYVRNFSFNHGLFGEGASSVDFVGIEFADGSTLGNIKNVKLRFPTSNVEG